MILRELTQSTFAATRPVMQEKHYSRSQGRAGSGRRAACAVTMLVAGALATTGCISVSAPDKPIVIELNINIKQEVVYRLAADAADTIKDNPDIF